MKNAYYVRIALFIILLSGLLLRLYGIDFGLPYLYNVDESYFVSRAAKMLATRDFNPHWFGHPGTTVIYYVIYALCVTTYETLMKMGMKIYEINRIPGENMGPTIRVYRFNGMRE